MRHISIRYFFVKDNVNKEEFSIEYCNTSEMLADYFTNRYKGHLFVDSGKSLWNGRMLTPSKIMTHLQIRSALKTMYLETNQKSCRRQLVPIS